MNTLTLLGGHEAPILTEVIPYSARKEASELKKRQFRIKTAGDTDALEAVKLDPAVLEARVTIDTSKQQKCDHTDARAPIAAPRDSKSDDFKSMVMRHEAALLSLTSEQYDLLMKFASTLRRQRHTNQMNLECAFCKNNGESVSWYTSHALRCWRGRVLCPVLRAYRCPRCGAFGDRAHTLRYCPLSLDDCRHDDSLPQGSQISGGCP
ncbi:uncharacterized protein LOC126371932 isoform X2 [Pectinophora gossypiella]|uniref:uncharacterized protein LOC126371932 isoform X2 n=1 Tax=Pectinophora gossypiella TaxID=13191 RepID=UPI00214EC1DD|nr:uncharacterized protein LOC126371932 isoform X2 [Pectinophora gossypiella]